MCCNRGCGSELSTAGETHRFSYCFQSEPRSLITSRWITLQHCMWLLVVHSYTSGGFRATWNRRNCFHVPVTDDYACDYFHEHIHWQETTGSVVFPSIASGWLRSSTVTLIGPGVCLKSFLPVELRYDTVVYFRPRKTSSLRKLFVFYCPGIKVWPKLLKFNCYSNWNKPQATYLSSCVYRRAELQTTWSQAMLGWDWISQRTFGIFCSPDIRKDVAPVFAGPFTFTFTRGTSCPRDACP